MKTSRKKWLAVGAPFTVAAFLATFAATRTPDITPAPACSFNIDDPLPIGPEPTKATTRFTEAMGDSLRAEFPEDAHVQVISIKRTKNDGALSATLEVSTSQAVAGQWNVIIHSSRGDCNGKVWVGQGAKAKVKKGGV